MDERLTMEIAPVLRDIHEKVLGLSISVGQLHTKHDALEQALIGGPAGPGRITKLEEEVDCLKGKVTYAKGFAAAVIAGGTVLWAALEVLVHKALGVKLGIK
jgi:hypothetical protein